MCKVCRIPLVASAVFYGGKVEIMVEKESRLDIEKAKKILTEFVNIEQPFVFLNINEMATRVGSK